MKTLLTVAGFDPSSGAGVTADLAVFAAHGYFGTSAITALTVQSTRGVRAVHACDPAVLAATLEELMSDIVPDGIKIGMLASAENVAVAAKSVARLRSVAPRMVVVLDPVVRASSGRELIDPAGIFAMHADLLPLVHWITPNRAELEALTGLAAGAEADIELSARTLLSQNPTLNIVVTGGDNDSRQACDLVLLANGVSHWLRAPMIESTSTHGTGCAFSSALLCALVDGLDGLAAATRAKAFVAEAIRTAPGIGHGRGPINLRRQS